MRRCDPEALRKAISQTPLLRKLRELPSARAVRAYLCGGFVRDGLLGRPTKDLDIAVDANPIPLARAVADFLGGSFVPLDKKGREGRVLVREKGEQWQIDISILRGRDIEEDLRKRDFTINALALPLEQIENPEAPYSHLIDPTGGRRDLEEGIIRAPQDTSFREDGARLLRAIRLAASLGFRIEERTLELIRADSHLVEGVSGERIRDELCGILDAPHPGRSLKLMEDLGLLARIIPELEAAKGVDQPGAHYWDVFVHSIQTVAAADLILAPESSSSAREDFGPMIREAVSLIPRPPEVFERFKERVAERRTRATILKLAALLHDIAKPQTKTVEDGRARFLGHARLGAEMAEEVLARLRLSNREIGMIKTMISEHLRPGQISQKGEMPTRRAIYRYFRDLGDVAFETLYLHLADFLASRGPLLDLKEWKWEVRRVEFIIEKRLREEKQIVPPRLVNGYDLMGHLELSPGPLVGKLLEAIREAQAAGEVRTKEEALELARRLLSEMRREAEDA